MSRRNFRLYILAVLAACTFALCGLLLWTQPTAQAAISSNDTGGLFAPFQTGQSPVSVHAGVRRESAPPSVGSPPRTGPASPFNPLVIPSFGVNVRANTDTQSPNLAQQEPSISINPTNPLNVVAMAKDERSG